jgi:aryl sulfotransferase
VRFSPRQGDIVISTRSKSGTTWMQMICALLVFETPKLPRPLSELSPWLDWLAIRESDLFAALEHQQHRRFIKTHTPLDGLPLYDDVHYVVVARDPLDMAVSLYHQGGNLDRERIAELTGTELRPARTQIDLVTWMTNWIRWSGHYAENLDSLPGVMWHLSDAWERRDAHNVVLVHYDDLLANLPGEMARLVDELGFALDPDQVHSLAGEATFAAMKARSRELIPDRRGVIKDADQFFRHGRSGAGVTALPDTLLNEYAERTSQLAPAELLEWLHRR